jgi:hypothetical protein
MKCVKCKLVEDCDFKNRKFDIDNSDHTYSVIGCKGLYTILIKNDAAPG